jgi:hypothetical protein
MAKKKDEPWLGLPKALQQVRSEWPNAPLSAIRQAVVDGAVASTRSSNKPSARYYVRWSVLKKYVDGLQRS